MDEIYSLMWDKNESIRRNLLRQIVYYEVKERDKELAQYYRNGFQLYDKNFGDWVIKPDLPTERLMAALI